ncbi:MAG TPA: universal stress protein [Xanthobacteraceae bacterium]|nr:universal stress protein [Xanthobacteraceae bacterium]
MYKQILVAVDGSETSNLALREAIKLAKDQKAKLRLVHVVDETPAYLMMDAEAPYLVADLQKALQTVGQKVLSTCADVVREAGIEADTTLKTTKAIGLRIYEAIEEEATRWPADLIVIGTHGRRGFRRLMLGSVAEGVTRIATKPVLLIRGS